MKLSFLVFCLIQGMIVLIESDKEPISSHDYINFANLDSCLY